MPNPPTAAFGVIQARPASAGRLLVVDDDRLVLATLVQGLEDAGFEVIDADNGDDAILLARQHRPDLALLDIRMDGLSGFDVAAYLREHLRIPFMFLSAFSDAATLAQIQSLGALASLVKPLDMAHIVPAVTAAHAQALALREAAAAVPGASVGAATGAPAGQVGPASTLLASAAGGAPGAGAGPAALLGTGVDVLDQTVAIALGIVMHRYSLKRVAALARLEQLATGEGRSLQASCVALVNAVEQLSLPG
jgi:response regulator NasT